MLQGYAGMISSDRRRRMATLLVLVNVSLVVLAAVWRHAAADDPELRKPNAAESSLPATAPTVDTQDEAKLETPATAAESANDPVMEELRKVIRDPKSGLDIPHLDETSPLEARAGHLHSNDPHSDDGHRQRAGQRMQQRMESMHALSSAALVLVREARSLSNSGMTAESDALMQHVSQLRAMIAALAAADAR